MRVQQGTHSKKEHGVIGAAMRTDSHLFLVLEARPERVRLESLLPIGEIHRWFLLPPPTPSLLRRTQISGSAIVGYARSERATRFCLGEATLRMTAVSGFKIAEAPNFPIDTFTFRISDSGGSTA